MTPRPVSGLLARERQRATALEQDWEYLIPIARRLARKAPLVSVDDVRVYAENAGLLLASEDRAYRSQVYGQLMHRAGLIPIRGMFRRTARRGTKGGNVCQLWKVA